jgi:hypothetical protein
MGPKYEAVTICANCKKECTKRVANKKSSVEELSKRTSFCSKECRKQYNYFKRKDLLTRCVTCDILFRLKSKVHSKKFCSRQCYYRDKKNNPSKYNTYEFAKTGQKYSNTPSSIQKMLQTKVSKGVIVDWKTNKDWKRFWKKCNELTRKIRQEMLKDWDGYDYYDGEYIKPYLKLSAYHKNYPTLDHKYPRSKAFQDGLTPYEITIKENLVWTKRTNNSKKGNKTLDV